MAVTLSLQAVEELASEALVQAGTMRDSAEAVGRALAAAERDGIASHGLAQLPNFVTHVRCGKVDGGAEPQVEQPTGAAVRVDAAHGFAHPAIDAGLELLPRAAQSNGVAAMGVSRSYNCGVVGHHVERLAEQGLVALAYVNAPAAIALPGGKSGVFGTNPMACAVPRADDAPIIIDQSASVIAKSEVVAHARKGEAIPDHWALDSNGEPTTDPNEALKGTMRPAGGQKGVGMAFVVEVMAAVLSGANLSVQAAPFSGTSGGPPGTGQFFIALDPAAFDPSGQMAGFQERIETLADAMTQDEGTRLPGQRRLQARAQSEKHGVQIDDARYAQVKAYTEGRFE